MCDAEKEMFPGLEPNFVVSCFLLKDVKASLDYYMGSNKRKIFYIYSEIGSAIFKLKFRIINL